MSQPDLHVAPAPTGAFEGAGLASDIADIWTASRDHHYGEAAVDATVAGINALGFIADPLSGLLNAGIGWLIEHVSFLNEGLNALAGDPGQVQAAAATWHNVAGELTVTANARLAAARGVTGWQGRGAWYYRDRTERLTVPAIQAGARAASGLADQALTAAAAVGTLRATIRDMITEFVAKMVEQVVVALAGAAETLSVSLQLFIVEAVVEGATLAGQIARMITKLVGWLAGRARSLDTLRGALASMADNLAALAARPEARLTEALSQARTAAAEVLDPSHRLPALARELAKQEAHGEEVRHDWRRPDRPAG
ncbi:MAG TPA: hypothetical protein VGH89_40750 [Pseudonocardia sp.]|jgi:hypothetical protein